MGMGVDAAGSNPGGSATGLNWWGNTMNGGMYEESPPPVSTPVSSPHAVSISVVTSAAASTSPSSSSAASNTTGPLHIPAKRVYDPADGGSVIRHPAQPWNYGESPQFEHQYPTSPPYYSSDGGRDSRKLGFWPPVTSSPPEYKYNPSAGVSSSGEHQAFANNPWCNTYPPYSSSRHDPHGHQSLPYGIQDDRRAAAAAMAAAAEGSFPHDGYSLRAYSDPVPTTPYPPPGNCLNTYYTFHACHSKGACPITYSIIII